MPTEPAKTDCLVSWRPPEALGQEVDMTNKNMVNSAAVDALLRSLDADASIDAIYRVHTVATILHDDGDYAAARQLFERALDACEATLAPGHRLTRSSLYQLAMISIRLEDQPSARYFIGRFRACRHSSRH